MTPHMLVRSGLAFSEQAVSEREMLVLSPHLDDAWLSCAALLQGGTCTVWTVFAGAPQPCVSTEWDARCGFAGSGETMAERLREDTNAFAATPHTIRRLPYLEAAYTDPVRRRRELAALRADLDTWLDEHPAGILVAPAGAGVHVPPAPWEVARERLRASASRIDRPRAEADGTAGTGRPHAVSPLRRLPRTMARHASQPVKRLMHADHVRRRRKAQHAGMAAHPDHLAVRDTALDVARSRGAALILFEDLPYLWASPGGPAAERAVRRAGAITERVDAEVDAHAKFERLQAYRSQLAVLDPERRRLEQREAIPGQETYWVVRWRRATRGTT